MESTERLEQEPIDQRKRVFLDKRRVRHRKCGMRLFDIGYYPWDSEEPSVGFWCRGCEAPVFLPWEVLEELYEQAKELRGDEE